MTASLVEVIEAVFWNLSANSDGAIHSATQIALVGMLWDAYWRDALQAGQAYSGWGPEFADSAFRESLANDLGMSRSEFDAFWDSPSAHPSTDPETYWDAEQWRETSDAVVELAELLQNR